MALVHQNRRQFCNDSDIKNVDMVHSLRYPTGVLGQRECIVPKGASRKLFLHFSQENQSYLRLKLSRIEYVCHYVAGVSTPSKIIFSPLVQNALGTVT